MRLPPIARQASPALLVASLSCWLLLYAASRELQSVPLCLPSQTLVTAGSAVSTIYGVNTTAALAVLSWIVMVVAMTAPLLARPIGQLRLRTLARRRNRSVALFAAAYMLVWIAIGPVLLAAPRAIDVLANATHLPAIAIAALLAAVWQAAPMRQRALNRCHRLPNLAAFGTEADRDCIQFGLTHGFWCAATCAPLMVLTLMVPAFHLPLMFILSLALQLERLAPPQTPCWTLRILPGQSAALVLFRSIRWSMR